MSEILHLTMREKFIKSFIQFTKENFNINQHFFLLVGGLNQKEFEIDNSSYCKTLRTKKDVLKYFLIFNKKMYTSDKIILHGLFQPYYVLYLFFNPWLLKKCYWVIWGGDLYSYQEKKTLFRAKIYELIRAVCIKNFRGIIAYPTGDYDNAKNWYGVKGKFYKCLFYPYFAVEDYLKHIKIADQKKDIIMIGNSATKSNEHLEIFKILSRVSGIKKYKILCPLSYGDKKYLEEVSNAGYKHFGDQFTPLTNFLSSNEYYNLLANVKIVIMGHKRQQATGNILALVKFKKKIFIRTDISTWNFYKENGIKLFRYEELEKELLVEISEEETNNNRLAIKKNFTYERITQEWSKIYNTLSSTCGH